MQLYILFAIRTLGEIGHKRGLDKIFPEAGKAGIGVCVQTNVAPMRGVAMFPLLPRAYARG